MRREGGFRPESVMREEFRFDGGAEFEEMESHWEEGISGRSGALDGAPIDRNEAKLSGHEEAHDAPHAARDVEEGGEDEIDGPMGDFTDLPEVKRFADCFHLLLELLAEEGEDEGGKEKGAIERFGGIFSHFVVDGAEELVGEIVSPSFQIAGEDGGEGF